MILIINNSNRNSAIKKYIETQKKKDSLQLINSKKSKTSGMFPLYVTDNLLKIIKGFNVPIINILSLDELIAVIATNQPITGIIIGGSELKLSLDNIPDELLLPSIIAIDTFKNRVPILGICFGFQIINQYFGGTIKSMNEYIKDTKIVHFTNGSKIKKSFFKSKLVGKYRFLHGDQIDKLGRNLTITSYNQDIVYSFQHNSLPIIGVQYHPEVSGELGMKFIKSFMTLCG